MIGIPNYHESASRRTVIGLTMSILMVFLLFTTSCDRSPSGHQFGQPSALVRIESSGEVRCSYLLYSPYFRKDPNTGELSGIFYDIMEAIGQRAELKIRWVEEAEYENIFTGLDANRYDVFAGGLWPSSVRAKVGYFTIPVFYSIITTWVRANESKWNSLEALNNAAVRIATKDGALEDIVARTDYPKAQRVSLPQGTPFSQNLLNITSNKADVTFAEPGIVLEYLKSNPGTLKQLSPEKPVRVFGNSLVVRRGDIDLKLFLDAALRELLYSGEVDRILRKYELGPNVYPRVARPYELTNETPGANP